MCQVRVFEYDLPSPLTHLFGILAFAPSDRDLAMIAALPYDCTAASAVLFPVLSQNPGPAYASGSLVPMWLSLVRGVWSGYVNIGYYVALHLVVTLPLLELSNEYPAAFSDQMMFHGFSFTSPITSPSFDRAVHFETVNQIPDQRLSCVVC